MLSYVTLKKFFMYKVVKWRWIGKVVFELNSIFGF